MDGVRLDEEACWERLGSAGHGVLATLHAERGVDAVPVVFVVLDRLLFVPVDTVKPKSDRRLQRLANVERDPRCALLVDHYVEDWSQLWWVRVHGQAAEAAPTDPVIASFAAAFPQYGEPGTIVSTIAIEPSAVTGWAATRSG